MPTEREPGFDYQPIGASSEERFVVVAITIAVAVVIAAAYILH